MDGAMWNNDVSAIVEYDYTAKEPDELNLVKGAILHNIKVQSGGWWEGTLTSGKTGMFPDNFVRILDPDDKNPVVLRDKSSTVNRKCRVVYSYTQNNNDELSLVVGDVIEFLGEVEEGWWRGKVGNKIGVFPSNFVTCIDNTSPVLEIRRNLKGSSSRLRNSFSSSREDLVLEKDAPSLPPKPVRELCQVLFPYAPSNEDELELKEGDIITILAKELADKGWWKGELKGKVGVFPDNFVVPMSSEASPIKESSRPDRPPATSKVLINNKSSNRKDSFGSKDSLNETTGIVTGNVAAYRKSLENRVTDGNSTAPTIEKATRKSFETKISSEFRKSLENLDEKKTTPPPVLSKKPIVPVKKSPTVSSVAGNLLSGLKQIVKSEKVSSNDSLDGIGSSKVITHVADNGDKGVVVERMKRDDCEFDQVERSSILQDMRASRVKAPKRRLPSTSVSISSNDNGAYQNGNTSLSDSIFDAKVTEPVEDESAKSKIRNWEKHKAPWMDELKANQAKKTSPNIEAKSPDTKTHIQDVDHNEKNDATKGIANTSSSSSHKKSIDNVELRSGSNIELIKSGSVDIVHKKETENIMSRSSSVLSSKLTMSDSTQSSTTTNITTNLPVEDNLKIRPSSVNLKNRSVSPVGRLTKTTSHSISSSSSPISSEVVVTNIKTPPNPSTGDMPITLDNVCPRVIELERKVLKLEKIVQQQSQTIDDLVKSLKDETEKVKILKDELEKYAQCVTQV